jgi:hypothetical protein
MNVVHLLRCVKKYALMFKLSKIGMIEKHFRINGTLNVIALVWKQF